MKKYLFVLLLICPFLGLYAQKFDTKTWHEGKITWNDFKAQAPSDTTAEIHIELKIMKVQDNKIIGKQLLYAFMDKEKSWVKENAKTDQNLLFAQAKFNIVHFYAVQIDYLYNIGDTEIKASNNAYEFLTTDCKNILEQFEAECNLQSAEIVAINWNTSIADSLKTNSYRQKFIANRSFGSGIDFVLEQNNYFGSQSFYNYWGASYSYYFTYRNLLLGVGGSFANGNNNDVKWIRTSQLRFRFAYDISTHPRIRQLPFIELIPFNMVERGGWDYIENQQSFSTYNYYYEGFSVPSFSLGYNIQWELRNVVLYSKIRSGRATATIRLTPVFHDKFDGLILSTSLGLNINWQNFDIKF